MKKIRPLAIIVVLIAILLAAVYASAEPALVVTPKGPLNLRRSPTTKSDRIASIPNHSTIEILEEDGEWAKAEYNGKTGFVMTEYLRIPSHMAGKTIYPDDYKLVMIKKEASASSASLQPADNLLGIPVVSVENGWAAVKVSEDVTGYVDASILSNQVETPPKTIKWIAERGEIAVACTLDLDGGGTAELEAGDQVTVTVLSNIECMVSCEKGCGYVPMAYVRLYGPEDTHESINGTKPDKALDKAMTALKKAYKGVANEKLTKRVAVYGGVQGDTSGYYYCGFYNEQGDYVYGVLIDAQKGTAIYVNRYSPFYASEPEPTATPEPTAEPTPKATKKPKKTATPEPTKKAKKTATPEPTKKAKKTATPEPEKENKGDDISDLPLLTPEPLDTEPVDEKPKEETAAQQKEEKPASEDNAEAGGDAELAMTDGAQLGDVIDFIVTAWTDHQVEYTITKGGAPVVSSGPVKHFSTAYQPRSAGDYEITITITDEEGATAKLQATFNVAEADTDGMLYEIYSQYDGRWASQSLGTSTLEKDGAAIFTMTHALERIGQDSVDILPERMSAVKDYSDCLGKKGMDNAKLVKAAAKNFGFSTVDTVYTKPEKIAEKLAAGAVFSFTNEKGNVVLAAGISADKSMVKIIDACPSLSFDTIPADTLFIENEDGSFRAITNLDDDPNSRWFMETDKYGGMEYWMKMETVASCGLLLIEKK